MSKRGYDDEFEQWLKRRQASLNKVSKPFTNFKHNEESSFQFILFDHQTLINAYAMTHGP